MKIGLAQITSLKGNIEGNIDRHIRFVEKAIVLGVDLICFPELSLTGYEPEIALEMGIDPDDERLQVLAILSEKISIMVGAPIRVNKQVVIGLIIIEKEKSRRVYLKQILHKDEEPYFVKGSEPMIFKYGKEVILPAICYESLQPEHFTQSEAIKPTIYLASVAKHEIGMGRAHDYYAKIAHEKRLHVAVVNAVGYSDNFYAAGNSAVWDSHGELKGSLESNREGLLIYNKTDWSCEGYYF